MTMSEHTAALAVPSCTTLTAGNAYVILSLRDEHSYEHGEYSAQSDRDLGRLGAH